MTARGQIRRLANRLGAPLGIQVVSAKMARRQFLDSQLWHLLLAMQNFSIDLVLDIGANVGQFACELIETGYKGGIISVEPLPDAHARLVAATSRFPRWSAFERVALGAEEGSVTMQVAGNSVSSSVLPMLEQHIRAAPGSKPTDSVEVRQTTLDAAFAGVVAETPTLIKIDTQGYERQVLAGGMRCLARAPLVLLELSTVPLYEGQWLWTDAIAYLRKRSFELWFLHPDFSDPVTGRVLQYNGLFARR
jgi:FkbM family methyltransferase